MFHIGVADSPSNLNFTFPQRQAPVLVLVGSDSLISSRSITANYARLDVHVRLTRWTTQMEVVVIGKSSSVQMRGMAPLTLLSSHGPVGKKAGAAASICPSMNCGLGVRQQTSMFAPPKELRYKVQSEE